MIRILNNPRNYIVLLLLFPLSQSLTAIPLNDNLLEYSLILEHQTSDFKFDSFTHSTNLDSIGLNWYESFSRYFNAGLEIGQLEMTQTSNSLASAQLSAGHYAGLLLQFLPFKNEHVSLLLNLNYRYNRSSWTALNQQTQFIWHNGGLSAELRFNISNTFNINTAIDYLQFQGQQRDSGPINLISDFREHETMGYRLGVEFFGDRQSVIGMEWLLGAKSGARIQFKYQLK